MIGLDRYLTTKEEIHSVKDAHAALGLLAAFEDEKIDKAGSGIEPLKSLGADIRSVRAQSPCS